MNLRILLISLLVLATPAAALTLNLTANATQVKVNDSIKFHITLQESDDAPGSVNIFWFNDTAEIYELVKKKYSSRCMTCSGRYISLGNLNEDFWFSPERSGKYHISAIYGTEMQTIYFYAEGPTTTTTTTTTSTSTTSSTSTTTTTSTTSTTSSTTTTSSTSTTTPPETKEESTQYETYLAAFVLVSALAVLAIKKKST